MNRPPTTPPPPTPSPPISGTRWEERRVTVGTSPPVTVLLRRDPTAPDGKTYAVLPKLPHVLRSANGDPTFTLTLTLQRQPRVDDTEIASLIERGQLGVTLSTAIAPEVLAALEEDEDATFKPLFAREIVATLEVEGFVEPVVIVSVSGSGSNAQLALSTCLDRVQALDTYKALDGEASRLRLRVRFTYRTSAEPRARRLDARQDFRQAQDSLLRTAQ